MSENSDLNQLLLETMRIIARQEIEKSNRDITKTGIITKVNENGTVTVKIDGREYTNIPNYNGTGLVVNDIVKVTYPQGQVSNMYVSGGGDLTEIIQSVDGTVVEIKRLDTRISNNTKMIQSANNAIGTLETQTNTHSANKSNPHAVTKAQVGLGNVNNTSDANKPISTATQAALDTKSPKEGSTSLIRLAENVTFGNGDGFTIEQSNGQYRQKIQCTDNSTTNDAVYTFFQSENTGASYKNLFEIRDNGSLYSSEGRVYTTGNKPNKTDVGLSNVPNVTTNNQTPSFTQATTLANIVSGETLTLLLSKISKAIADLISHLGDTVKHITAIERTNWNTAYTNNHTHSNKSIIDKLTQAMLDKLAGIAVGAEVNVQSDWNITDTTSDAFIKNKPTSMPANGGNAATADKLKTARLINGVSFDGSQSIAILARPLVTELTNESLDDVKAFGEYYAGGGHSVTTGLPFSVEYFNLQVFRVASGYIGQELFWDNRKFFRYYNNTKWLTWAEILTTKSSLRWNNIIDKPDLFPPTAHTHSYLPLTGGVVTGLTKFTKGTYIIRATGTDGTNGFVKIVKIKINAANTNTPLTFVIAQRNATAMTYISVLFKNADTTDPDIVGFSYFGYNGNVYIHKESAGVWNLYIKKTEAYDSIGVVDYWGDHLYEQSHMTLTWYDKEMVTTLPTGYITASLLLEASKAKSAAKLTTARTIQVGNATKSFDGTSNVSFSLGEIGVGGSFQARLVIATVAGWVGTAAPYTQVLTVEGVSATCNVEVGLASNATLAQIKDCGKALVWCTAQGTNQITLTAHNKKPTVDLPIQILIIG